jgi:hypothetical protein
MYPHILKTCPGEFTKDNLISSLTVINYGIQLTGLIDNCNFPHKLLCFAFNGTDLNE